MITLLRLVSYPFRWLLALLLALPTSFALYQIVRPQSSIAIQAQAIYDAMDQLQRLAATWGVSTPMTPRPPLDWGLIILLSSIAFTLYSAFLNGWRLLPLVIILVVPVFEGMRYYRPPISYTAETAWLWWAAQLLTSPLVIAFVVVVVGWRAYVYSRMLARIGWRWTSVTAGMALLFIAVLRFFTPARAIFEIETSAHPGSAWLATLMLTWGGLAWIVWRLKPRPTLMPVHTANPKKDEITFDEAYERVRARHG